jgi:hypothetical protein
MRRNMTIKEKVELIVETYALAHTQYAKFLEEADQSEALQNLVMDAMTKYYTEDMGSEVKKAIAYTYRTAWVTGATWIMIQSLNIKRET